jgi:release factor glutamine methyltransferase
MSNAKRSIADARRDASALLANAGHASARLEADLLLSAATGLDRTTLIAHGEQHLGDAQQDLLQALLRRRAQGEPIAHLLGRREFWSLEFGVTSATLIPRPETELLVELTLSALPDRRELLIADLGTGSGAVAAALAHERPRWSLIAVELHAAALAVAAHNARHLGLRNLHPMQGNWLEAVGPATLDAIVANPPYIAEKDPHLACGDLRFEPRAALAAGVDGLAAIRTIVAEAHPRLRPHGLIALEHGWDQAEAVRALLAAHEFAAIATSRDLAGHERVTKAHKPGAGRARV